jgi:hypothetical protein
MLALKFQGDSALMRTPVEVNPWGGVLVREKIAVPCGMAAPVAAAASAAEAEPAAALAEACAFVA